MSSLTLILAHLWSISPWPHHFDGSKQERRSSIPNALELRLSWIKPFDSSLESITVMSYEHHDILNHWQVNCLFNSLFRLTSNNSLRICISGSLWGESTTDWWIPLSKGQLCGKCIHYIMQHPPDAAPPSACHSMFQMSTPSCVGAIAIYQQAVISDFLLQMS